MFLRVTEARYLDAYRIAVALIMVKIQLRYKILLIFWRQLDE